MNLHHDPKSTLAERYVLLIYLTLAVCVLSIYASTVYFDFVNLDDQIYITTNPFIRSGLTWQSLKWALTADFFRESINVDYWQPLTSLSHIIDIQLSGLNPTGHHVTNIVLHLFNTWLIFFLLDRLTGRHGVSFFTAALFAVHPMQTEAVVWITARKDLLSTFFGLLTIVSYTAYARKQSLKPYLISLFMFAFSLMSKPALLALPILLHALDAWSFKRIGQTHWIKLIFEKLPYYLSAFFSAIILSQSGSSLSKPENTSFGFDNLLINPPLYLRHFFYPFRLILYDATKINVSTVLPSVIIGLAVVAFTVYAVEKRHTKPLYLLGIIWFITAILPALGLYIANRYIYFPLIGLGLILAEIGSALACKGKNWKITTGVAAALSILFCSVLSAQTLLPWQNSETLLTRMIEVDPNHYKAHNNLAAYYESQGDNEKAVKHFVKAIWLNPYFPDAHNNLAVVLSKQGHFEIAEHHFKKALEYKPDFANAYTNLGNLYLEQNRNEEAFSYYQKALELQPDSVYSIEGMGLALYRLGRPGQAVQYFQKALSIDPQYSPTYIDWGSVLAQDGKFEEALIMLKKGMDFDPSYGAGYTHLSYVLGKLGRYKESIQYAQRALAINPKDRDALQNLKLSESLIESGKMKSGSTDSHSN
ncbi:MAG: hypothetical protein COW12_02245 [Candidatus Omnitrophica bacterium CG12_big_fil_rev_8_21_14_0_65_45_16]|nr:MAG: hypothetical protein COW12_02245 [Candidatus Omnitrophica bacterium CG12_big_fil_rev_8_21_14_0_65_45_16]